MSITDDERRTLDACIHATVVTVPGAGDFIANTAPARVTEVLLGALDVVRM